jgi:iron complex transport system permease protein
MPARRLRPLLLLSALAAAVLLHALISGELPLDSGALLAALSGQTSGHTSGLSAQIVLDLRLPRALAAFACGGLLALSGVLMQALLRNPLADPYVLGISSGAAVGAMLAMLCGLSWWAVQTSAFAGSLAVMALVLGLARGAAGWAPTRLLLTGVIVGSGCGALIALMLSLAPPLSLPPMLFWLMGDAGNATQPAPALLILLLGLAAALPFARDLNVLCAAPLSPHTLGVAVSRLQLMVYLHSALMTAVSVSTVGAVGFVGLIVPHALRLTLGADHRLLLPAAVLAGGSVLTFADTLARTVMSPLQLPVGVLMALIGVPVFLGLLSARERE